MGFVTPRPIMVDEVEVPPEHATWDYHIDYGLALRVEPVRGDLYAHCMVEWEHRMNVTSNQYCGTMRLRELKTTHALLTVR